MKAPYPIPVDALGILADASYWLRTLQEQGTRQQHGIGPNRPLTAAMRRDADIAQRALLRFILADKKNRDGRP